MVRGPLTWSGPKDSAAYALSRIGVRFISSDSAIAVSGPNPAVPATTVVAPFSRRTSAS
ncbi:hypothetical protein STRAU_4234 [Streptomyces aurantiacus JA 4570]|uniref:Uncharacterized protein n=1 Tax=Streptomyces aurantiacus JA 4570 TaxID=1286094 RepID=S3ZJ16_9ACTN|nr:hypothetical protein STRAU_4234 [Streptomyces aurantiacus JA 4570]